MPFDIEKYVEDHLSNVTQSGRGNELTALCPRCDAGGGKFYVNSTTGKFICFKCDFRGDNIAGLVAHCEGISYRRAREFIFKNTIVFARRSDYLKLKEIFEDFLQGRRGVVEDDEEDNEPVDVQLPKSFVPCWNGKKWRFPTWLKDRGIKKRTAKAWGLGFCRIHPRYAGRLVIPIVCPNGRSFTARDMTGEQKPKYLNPSGGDHGCLLYGWNVMPETGSIVLCEGPFDALKLWQYSFAALAVGGKELHARQLAMLKMLNRKTRVIIMLDGEEKVAPEKMAQKLSIHFSRIQIASLPYKVDPGDASYRQVMDAMVEAKRWHPRTGAIARAKFSEFLETRRCKSM